MYNKIRNNIQVVIDDLPFAEGALRACYRMQLVNENLK